jgi:tetratricopeptide (TPR) repeat protein
LRRKKMVNCPCGYGKNIKKSQDKCHICGIDLAPLHRLKEIPENLCGCGDEFLKINRPDEAMESFMAAIVLGCESETPYIRVAEIYSKKCMYEEALSYCGRALEKFPSSKAARAAAESIKNAGGSRPAAASEQACYFTYRVRKHDCLKKIAVRFYGSDKFEARIIEANKEKFRGSKKVFLNDVLMIPAVKGE